MAAKIRWANLAMPDLVNVLTVCSATAPSHAKLNRTEWKQCEGSAVSGQCQFESVCIPNLPEAG